MRRFIGAIIAVALLLFLAAQLYRPKIDHPPVTAEIAAPPEVKQILRNSCYNCHSNETRLVWWDKIVPAYWFVVDDGKLAREQMNFSGLGQLPAPRQKAFLYEAVNQIQLGAMPLWSYKLAHPGSLVTPAELATLKD